MCVSDEEHRLQVLKIPYGLNKCGFTDLPVFVEAITKHLCIVYTFKVASCVQFQRCNVRHHFFNVALEYYHNIVSNRVTGHLEERLTMSYI